MRYFKMVSYDTVATIDRLQRVGPVGVLRVGDALPCEALERHEGGVHRHALVEVQVVDGNAIASDFAL